jgi:predicted secreted protein
MLTAMKNLTPFTLLWDETLTTDNQTPDDSAYARSGKAFLSDATFTFNDREISSKSLQFTGTGPISEITVSDYAAVSAGSYTRGQFVRLFVSDVNNPAFVIAGAKQLSLHVSVSVEDSTTKDTTGDWVVNEPTALNYDISTTALVRSDETITSSVDAQTLNSLMEFWEDNDILYWQITNVSGDNNRTKGAIIASGQCIIQSLTINAPNRQDSTYQVSLAGYGIYSVSS